MPHDIEERLARAALNEAKDILVAFMIALIERGDVLQQALDQIDREMSLVDRVAPLVGLTPDEIMAEVLNKCTPQPAAQPKRRRWRRQYVDEAGNDIPSTPH